MSLHSAAERAAITASQRRIQIAFTVSFIFVAALWWIRLVEWLGDWNWSRLGVHPHVIGGLIGVVTAPLLHVSWEHLLANTLPVLILGTALLYGYPKASWLVVPLLWLGSGVGVWFTGPPGFHLGASGLVMGFITFLIVAGALRRDRTSAAITCAVAFLYGTSLVAIVPGTGGEHISYITHAWGAGIGLICALALFRLDPIPPRKHLRFEDESEDYEDPVIGDLWRETPPEPYRPNPPVRDNNHPPRLH
ncbi:MAG: rhomboid family intramembrane serine protease [Alcaligenaceae bacterium]|nr:rhomboid family intramembrane serine protease [Alcaligenaceae bacterium]